MSSFLKKFKKEKINIWNIIILLVIPIILFSCIFIVIYNTDWYINEITLNNIKISTEISNNIQWRIDEKYEENQLKMNIKIWGIERNNLNYIYHFWNNDEPIIKLYFFDKNNFKLFEKNISINDFIPTQDKELNLNTQKPSDVYLIYLNIPIEKNVVRKVNKIETIYKTALDND